MGTLVPKYRFLNSSSLGVHFANGMVRRPFTMAQATGITCFCESSSKLVHAHRISGFAVGALWHPPSKSERNSPLQTAGQTPSTTNF